MARGLRSHRKNLVALIEKHKQDTFMTFPYFSIFSSHVITTLIEEGIYVITTFEESKNKPHITYRSFVQKNLVDGFIVMGMEEDDKRLKFLLDNNESFVTVGRNSLQDSYTWVDCDNVRGGYLAGKHLIDIGCRRVLLLNGFKRSVDSISRYDGFKMAFLENNLPFDESLVVYGDYTGLVIEHPNTNFAGYDSLKEILRKKKIDGVFATSDVSAIGCLKLLKFLKMDIPVVGFDDVPLARIFEPQLTTIRQPIKKIAESVAKKMIAKIKGQGMTSEMFPVELIERESTLKFK